MMNHKWLGVLAMAALVPLAGYAQTTLIYTQNFESPQGNYPVQCADPTGNAQGAGNMGWSGVAAAYSTASVPFIQRNTADVICITQVGTQDDVTDPQAKGGNYSIGFHGGNPDRSDYPNTVESIGYVFDPQGKSVLTGSFDATLMGLPGRAAIQFSYPATPVDFKVDFYEVPTNAAAIDIEPASAPGQQLHARFGGVVQTPFESLTKSITNVNPQSSRFTLDWHAIDFEIDLRKMTNPSSRVMMVLTGLPEMVYLTIDNIVVSVAPNVVTVPSTTMVVQPGTTGSFNTTPGTSNTLNLPVAVNPNNYSVSDPAAGTVVLDSATGTFSFTPNPGFTGRVTVTYQACDNQAPTCSSNGSIVFDVPAPTQVVTVPNGAVIVQPGTTGTFDTTPGTSNTLNLPVAVDPSYTVDNPNAGTVTQNPATGVFSFTPNPGFSGAVTVTYRSCDNQPSPVCSNNGTVVFTVPSGGSAPAPGVESPTPVPVGGPGALLGLGVLMLWGMSRQAPRKRK